MTELMKKWRKNMKKYYNLVVSVLDVNGDRINSEDITGSNDKKEILAGKTQRKITKNIPFYTNIFLFLLFQNQVAIQN